MTGRAPHLLARPAADRLEVAPADPVFDRAAAVVPRHDAWAILTVMGPRMLRVPIVIPGDRHRVNAQRGKCSSV